MVVFFGWGFTLPYLPMHRECCTIRRIDPMLGLLFCRYNLFGHSLIAGPFSVYNYRE